MLVGMGAVAVVLHRVTGDRELTWRFAKARARTLTRMLGVRVRVEGREHLAAGGPFVFTPNHQSHLDILVLLGYLPGETRFAAKRELWRHRVMGAVLDTLCMVPIDREHPERAATRLRAEGRGQPPQPTAPTLEDWCIFRRSPPGGVARKNPGPKPAWIFE